MSGLKTVQRCDNKGEKGGNYNEVKENTRSRPSCCSTASQLNKVCFLYAPHKVVLRFSRSLRIMFGIKLPRKLLSFPPNVPRREAVWVSVASPPNLSHSALLVLVWANAARVVLSGKETSRTPSIVVRVNVYGDANGRCTRCGRSVEEVLEPRSSPRLASGYINYIMASLTSSRGLQTLVR